MKFNAFCSWSPQIHFWVFFNSFVSGLTLSLKFGTNLRYQPSMPNTLRNSFTFLGAGYSRIGRTFSGLVLIPCSSIIKPRYFISFVQNSLLFQFTLRCACRRR
uniref:Uncharacterized protein n=1 Tax=Cacopsylla melanoneura TaxID=428564 RepID=A0A8D9A279_9HEMI